MLKKTSRQKCLEKFSTFPIRDFDKIINEDVIYYPEIYKLYWLKVQVGNKIQLKNKIAEEIVSLYRALNKERLTFLCDFNSSWITKNSKERNDIKEVVNAVQYLRDQKIGWRFNGSITVGIEDLKEFLKHFFVLTRFDGSFSYYHFVDDDQDIIGYIHYDGEVRFDTTNEEADAKFLNAVKFTSFENTGRATANSIS